MATVRAFVRVSAKKSLVNVRFYISAGRGVMLYHVSEIEIDPQIWDNRRQEIKPKAMCSTSRRNEMASAVATRKSLILEIFDRAADKSALTSKWLDEEIARHLHPDPPKTDGLFAMMMEYIDKARFSELRRRDFHVIYRTLQRFDAYRRILSYPALDFDNFTTDTLYRLESFLHNEWQIFEEYPEIAACQPYRRKPAPRGQNTINHFLGRLRSFFIWAVDMEVMAVNPFRKFSIEESVYGTPYYITIDERDRLYRTNLSRHPRLAVQRDIFVFQCLIGCRVGDLLDMTKRNVINGAIEYVASKTRDGRPVTVRVPLSATARAILDRYRDYGDKLLPFISVQRYNDDIKRIFLAARLRRPVTVINPTTRQPEIRPLNEIASSHLARRTFVGNLYKKVKDPNLVGALSGHREGSKSFARYRDIDEDMKMDLVKLLEK